MAMELSYLGNADAVNDQEKIETEERQGFSRTIAGIEWLLAIVILLYLRLPGTAVDNENAVLLAVSGFVLFIIITHYSWPGKEDALWKLTAETWVMIGLITFVLWHTGKIESPLVSLYFLVVVTSAMVLGVRTTMLEVALISACCLLLGFSRTALEELTIAQITGPLIQLFPLWLVAYLIAMITGDMQHARNKIQLLSQTDYLTGLWNMRMFFALMHKEFDRSRRHGHHFCVMMLDADNLKRINDTYGHDCGSAMITMFADRIQQTVRRSDVIARFGGDEFVVLLPETKLARVGAAAERVRKAIEKSTLKVPGAEECVSVSIGIAGYPDHGGDVQEIIKKADIALYQSKRDGKNRATVYSG